MPATPCRRATARWACRPSSSQRHIAYDIGAAQRDARARRGAGRPGGDDALLAAADRPQPRRRRPHPDHAPLRRRRRSPATAASTRPSASRRMRLYYQPYHRAIDAVIDRCLASGVAPMPAVDPLLHRELEGAPAAVARRRAVGQGPAPGRAAARGPLRRGRPHRRRQRALLGPARGRLPVAARHLPRARQRADRDPPGPDPRRGRPGGLGAAALPHCRDDSEHYIEPRRPLAVDRRDAGRAEHRRSAASVGERMEKGP